jgi:hypothetical protein
MTDSSIYGSVFIHAHTHHFRICTTICMQLIVGGSVLCKVIIS